jgi:D-sedoheptulose 7-phosphate isomerase
MAAHIEEIRRQLAESARIKQAFSDALVARIAEFAMRSAAAIRHGGKLVFFGNGGSAADAQHLAAELVVRLRTERPGLPALALTTNTSVLTAAGNDYGFERIFSRQIESLVALTGETGGALAGKVDILLDVPSRDPQRIQESHITIGHIVCSLIEHLVAAN